MRGHCPDPGEEGRERQSHGPANFPVSVQVLDGGRAVRVVDAFGLSNDSVHPDELWGGRQSILGVQVEKVAAERMMTVWVRKMLAGESLVFPFLTLKAFGNKISNRILSYRIGPIWDGTGRSTDLMPFAILGCLYRRSHSRTSDPSNPNADLTLQRGQIPVFLASGKGPMPMMGHAELLEFAMVDLMAGGGGGEEMAAGLNFGIKHFLLEFALGI